MGCGASSTVSEDTAATSYGPDGQRVSEWWIAGEARPGGVTVGGEVIPDGAPFASSPYAKSGRDGMIQFAKGQIDKSGEGDICKQFAYSDDVYGRAFFSHPLPCYSIGWAMLDLTKERPHYNTKKMKEKEAELQRNGKEVDYSARKRFFLFPESIKEIGLMLKMNGKPQALEIAQSSDSWDIEPIEGSFFTFTPDRGSVFGSSSSGPEQSLPFPLKPHHSDSQLFADVRWSRLQLEFLRLLRKQGDTTSVFKLEIVYSYGNWKFLAWNPDEAATGGKAPAYRYSDEDRDREDDVSVPIASGEFKIKVSKTDLKQLDDDITEMEKVYNAAKAKLT
eukprot:Rhum_TRINITY_DN25104_c0_g1::Rhum_TRINITY_DN25104_c0_g1_i1::g.181216::m.181216